MEWLTCPSLPTDPVRLDYCPAAVPCLRKQRQTVHNVTTILFFLDPPHDFPTFCPHNLLFYHPHRGVDRVNKTYHMLGLRVMQINACCRLPANYLRAFAGVYPSGCNDDPKRSVYLLPLPSTSMFMSFVPHSIQ